MADPKKEEKKPGINYESLGLKLREHAEGEHIDEITERLAETFLKYKKSVGNKRKFNTDEAEALGHQLYDTLTDYVASDHYKANPENAKALKGMKGKHGDKLLDTLVENMFKIDRKSLIKNFKEHVETGKNFSKNYIEQIMKDSLNKYHGHVQTKILGELSEEHIDELKGNIGKYIKKHNLKEKDYGDVLKSKDFGTVIQSYVQLASQYHMPEEKKPDKK